MNEPYFTIGEYLKERFGCKVIKLSLDAGFTCPNRDGSKGLGGCTFCSEAGSGDFASWGDFASPQQITAAMEEQVLLLSQKWPRGKYLAYFQAHTNTYAPVSVLRELFETALSFPGVVGLAIATRPDCLPDDVMALLSELHQKTFLWVELGLQTAHEKTAELINRCYPRSIFEDAFFRLSQAGIRSVVHLMLGLPEETREDMLSSVRYVAAKHPFGVKLHLLHLLSGTRLAETMTAEAACADRDLQEYFPSRDEYIRLIADVLELLPPDVTIHRLTGDGPRRLLLAPLWSTDKRAVLNGVRQELKRRGTHQGHNAAYLSSETLPSL